MNISEACKILGVSETASEDTIKAKYREMMKLYHPDNFTQYNDDFAAKKAEDMSKNINLAYDTIIEYKKNNTVVQSSYSTTTTPPPTYHPPYDYRQQENYYDTNAYNRNPYAQQTAKPQHKKATTHKPQRRRNSQSRIILKYVLNVLAVPTFGIMWVLVWIFTMFQNVINLLLWVAAGIGLMLDFLFYLLGRMTTNSFLIYFIPIILVGVSPFILSWLVIMMQMALDRMGKFLTKPAEYW